MLKEDESGTGEVGETDVGLVRGIYEKADYEKVLREVPANVQPSRSLRWLYR